MVKKMSSEVMGKAKCFQKR
ncbi:uncharacterized protein G2W53_002121 [Senna tora]|uniref:Uncharacterized protein n=1 Tax=Senna tora TaxID=362788 RepID=A0A835CJ70_9FABA|nr:uncharacterized protein G2W53_002121 [Senna tora]